MLLVPLWAMNFVAGTPIGSGWPPTFWHGHEMLFGFIASAIAEVMLTAVPRWTGQKGFAGRPLIPLLRSKNRNTPLLIVGVYTPILWGRARTVSRAKWPVGEIQ
jgi:NnrS protein